MYIVSSYAIKGLRHKYSGYVVFSSISTFAFGVVGTSAALASLFSTFITVFFVFGFIGLSAELLGIMMLAHFRRNSEAWREFWSDKGSQPPTFLV